MAQSIYTIPDHPLLACADDVDAWLEYMEDDRAHPEKWDESRVLKEPLLSENRLAAFRDLFKDPTKDVDDIAARIDAWNEEDGSLWMMWVAVLRAISKLPSQHERLLDLVVAIHRLAPKTGPYSLMPPEMGIVWTERTYGCWISNHPIQRLIDETACDFFYANLFTVKMTKFGLEAPDSEPPAVKDLGNWLIRGALELRHYLEHTPWDPDSVTFVDDNESEDDYETIDDEGNWIMASELRKKREEEVKKGEDEGEEDDSDSESFHYVNVESSVRAFDYFMLFAHPWIQTLAWRFYDLCKARSEFPSDVPGRNMPSNFGIGRGYCMERWDFWRRRFDEVAATEELLDLTRRLAREAADTMRQIEREKEGAERSSSEDV